jgi:hypothetical protein
MEVGPRLELDDVPLLARREVVERVDLPVGREQQLGEMGADEAGAAGDQCLARLGHGRRLVERFGRRPATKGPAFTLIE